MNLIAEIEQLQPEMQGWRRRLHAHPETAFEEVETARLVATLLRGWGYDVHEGLGGTGVVGTLVRGPGEAIGLRADMDALPISEESDLPHRSTVPGRMHACGHDGHTAMLLGAARHLAAAGRFRGTLHVIFQPAEENEGGARVMIEDGLFTRFPMRAVFGLHNWPGLPAGRIALRSGPVMAACDAFEIVVTGRGCHGGMPHLGHDPIVASAAIVSGLQTVASRSIPPHQPVVVSVTQIQGGETWNAIPEQVLLRGTARSFDAGVQVAIEQAIGRLAEGIAAAHGCRASLDYRRQYPATVNHAAETELAAAAAAAVVGAAAVDRAVPPSMGAEDFAFMLQRVPGCYAWLGSGRGGSGEPGLHHPRYDFNDDVLAVGASYWVRLAEAALPATGA